MSDSPQPFLDKAFWWLAGLVVMLIGTVYGFLNRDIARVDRRVDKMDAAMTAHLKDAADGLQRVARVEETLDNLVEERRESAKEIREDIGTIHRRLDELFGPKRS